MRLGKLSFSVAGFAIAAGVLILSLPRAAHAVAAALVQITNTAASPVITQSIGQQAAQIVHIRCGGGLDGCFSVASNTVLSPGNYVVPNDQTLVITSVDIVSKTAEDSPCMSFSAVTLDVSVPGMMQPGFQKEWIVPGGTGTAHYVYPSGFLIAPRGDLLFGSNSLCSLVRLDMLGYLTAQ